MTRLTCEPEPETAEASQVEPLIFLLAGDPLPGATRRLKPPGLRKIGL